MTYGEWAAAIIGRARQGADALLRHECLLPVWGRELLATHMNPESPSRIQSVRPPAIRW